MGLRGKARVDGGTEGPRRSCFLGPVETRERLIVSPDKIAGNGLLLESDVTATLTWFQR